MISSDPVSQARGWSVEKLGDGSKSLYFCDGLRAVTANMRQCVPLLLIVFVVVGCSGCAGSVGVAADQSPGIDAQISACNRATCDLQLPPGNFTFSTELNPSAIVKIEGAGASYDNPGIPETPQYPFVESHCITTLTWIGGSRAPFLFNSYHATGSKLSGFCLNATGASPPVFIDVDQAAGDIQLDDVIIDTPSVKAQIAAIRYGNQSFVSGPKCTDVFVRASAPIGFELLNVEAHFMGLRCRAVWNDVNEWVIGDASHLTESFHCVFCTAESSPGNTPVIIQNVSGFFWTDGYTEGVTAFEIPASAVSAQQVSISNSFASGGGNNGVLALVDSQLASASVTVTGNQILGGSPSYIVEDDALSHATVMGNTMPSAMVAKNGSKVCAFGNAARSAPTAPPSGFCN
jgi:hypothetical protein